MGYITTIKHFLDENGDFAKEMPQEAKELAGFLALIIDSATSALPETLVNTDIRCFKAGCDETVIVDLPDVDKEIYWFCPYCNTEGVISDWQKTKWDNS